MATLNEIYKKIRNALPDYFNKSDNTLVSTVLKALSQEIATIQEFSQRAIDSLILQNSTDEFLSYWGSWYGIQRLQNESDLQYATRILAEIKLPKQTIPSIKTYLSKILNIPENQINIYEPFQDIFKLSGNGVLSGIEKLTDSEYWNWTVIDIQAPVQYNEYIRTVLQQIKAGGIKIFWSHLIPPQPPILDMSYSISLSNLVTTYTQIAITFSKLFRLSQYGDLSDFSTLSGQKVLRQYLTFVLYPFLVYNPTIIDYLQSYYTTQGYGTQAYGTTWYGARLIT